MTQPPAHRLHIFGASGSGTTTLGAALAQRMGVPHLESDDFYWVDCPQQPYTHKRPPAERVARQQHHREFLAWAARYDTEPATSGTRNLLRHRAWMAQLHCPVLALDSRQPVAQLVETVLAALATGGARPGL